MSENFVHHQAAHCESGVISNLLKNIDVPLSEPMSFGIGSGLFFVHMPFAKVLGLPLTSYRSFPGTIFKKTCRRLKIDFEYHTYRDMQKGEKALDQFLNDKKAVGLRSNIYWLPYIPEQFRFQFNAHHFVIYGKNENGDYAVSDPILEETSTCPAYDLRKARFAKGMLAPKGLIFFPKTPKNSYKEHLAKAVRAGIKETTERMLYSPLPMTGVRGIRYLSRQMRKYPTRLKDLETQKLYVANVVRMQEEIGTGGAGFRYLYAAFLQEAGNTLNNPVLLEAATKMNAVGDMWRQFATLAAQFCKGRLTTSYDEIPDTLLKIADLEKEIYKDLRGRYL